MSGFGVKGAPFTHPTQLPLGFSSPILCLPLASDSFFHSTLDGFFLGCLTLLVAKKGTHHAKTTTALHRPFSKRASITRMPGRFKQEKRRKNTTHQQTNTIFNPKNTLNTIKTLGVLNPQKVAPFIKNK